METNTASTQKEEHLILLSLNNYLRGRPVKDIERLKAAFHPDAYIRTMIVEKLVQWTVP
jgi:hypothetical protein